MTDRITWPGKDRATVNKYAEQLVRHVRETGALIGQLPRGKGGRGKTGESDFVSFLADAVVEKRTAQNWQSLATHITDTVFERQALLAGEFLGAVGDGCRDTSVFQDLFFRLPTAGKLNFGSPPNLVRRLQPRADLPDAHPRAQLDLGKTSRASRDAHAKQQRSHPTRYLATLPCRSWRGGARLRVARQ